MSRSAHPIVVRGHALSGGVRFEAPLGHGVSPQRLLRAAGWRPVEMRGWEPTADDGVILDYAVLPAATQGGGSSTARPETERAVRHQRLAAYAVVRGAEGVLLTELSENTSRAGLWVLPGGGVEPGETPDAAVLREVWEESGQEITLGPLVDVSTTHRVGEFRGGLEDFHAVRMIFSATCETPRPLVVHDVGGSTGRAAWFSAEDITAEPVPRVSGGVAPWVVAAVRTASGRTTRRSP